MNKKLYDSLLKDLKSIGIDTSDMTIVLRPFHKRFHGRYLFNERKMFLYIYQDKEQNNLRPYIDTLKTAIHESVHHIMGLKQVMHKDITHGKEFHALYDLFISFADELGLLDEKRNNDFTGKHWSF